MKLRRSGWALAEVCLAWMFLLGSVFTVRTAGYAQTTPAIPTTQISDTVYTASGTPAAGTVLISWPAFSTGNGQSVPAGSTSVTIGAAGALSVRLVANAGSNPIGSYYTVIYHLSDGTGTREYWVVPVSSATVSVGAIKSTVLPASVAMQTVSKSYVDRAIAAAVTGAPIGGSPYVQITGDTMTGPLVLSADPTAPLQASDKNYVDTRVAGLTSGLGQKVSTVPAGSQAVSQPAGTSLAVNNLNGVEYASQYVTGAGNNGIANATAACTGCDVTVEHTYASAEPLTPTTWSNQTHVQDNRGGATTESFLNPLPPLGQGGNSAKTISVTSTQSAQSILAATGSSQIFSTGLTINNQALAGGSNVYPTLIQGTVPYFKTTYTGLQINGTNNTLGQHVQVTQNQNCYGVGDCLLGGQFLQASGGFRDDADEGTHPFDRVFTEDPRVFTGTCASGCATGSTLVQIAPTASAGTQGEGRYLVNTNPSKAITGGTLTGAGPSGGRQPSATFSGVSFPISVFLATAQAIPTQANSINPGTVTFPILTSAVPSGFATNTAALPASTGVACISDVALPDQRPLNFETATYTVVDGSHLQMSFVRPHASGATIAVGGLCGYGLEQKVDTVNGIRQVFPVIGSPAATSLLYAGGYSSIVGLQGLTSAYINASLVVASIARTGNVVTVTTTANLPQDLNGLTLTVQGVGDSSYNGNFAMTTTGPNTLTYANSGPNSTSSGGSLTYVTGSYGLYPMAEVLSVYNTTTKAVDGQMTLAANTVNWASGDTVEQPHYFQEWVSADTDQVTQFTPRATRYQSAGVLYQGNNGAGLFGWQINNATPASNYFGNGGTHTPPTSGMNVVGVWNRSLEMQAGEQMVFDVHCNSHGCNRWNSNYNLFQLDSSVGADTINYSPSTSTLTYYLRGTGYTFAPSGLTTNTINATTVNAGTITGSFSGQASSVGTIAGLVAAGTNVTVTGSGTAASPYTIASSGGGGTTLATSANVNTTNPAVQVDSVASSTLYGLDCFGDSYMSGQGATSTANGQCAVVGSDLNIAQVNNLAVPGDTSADLAYHVLTTLNPGDSGNPIVIAAASSNNVPSGTAGLPNFNQNTYAAYAWGSMSSTNKILAGAAGVTIGGTTATDTTFANANGKTCSTGTCTFTYSAVVGQTGAVYLWYAMRATGGSISVTVDGAAATDTVTNATSVTTAWGFAPSNNTVTVGLARYVATPGSHTLVVTATSGATVIGFGLPNTLRTRGVTYPRMFMGGTAKLPSATLAASQVYNNASIAVSQRLVSDGLDVPFVDLLNAYNPNLDFVSAATQNCPASAQTNHPNNCGHRDAAGAWEANINAVPTAVAGTSGGAYTVGNSLYIPASDGAPANVNLPSFWQMPSRYTDSLIPKLDFGSNGGCNFGAGQAVDTVSGNYGMMLYGCSGKAIQFAYADPLTTASTNANFHVSDYITLPDGNWHGTGAFYTGGVTVGTSTAVSGAALTVGGLTSGNGWSNGANTTPIYNYINAMGTQPGTANDEEVFTNSGGTVSLGGVTGGTFTPWLKVSSTNATLPGTATVGTTTPVAGSALTVSGLTSGNGWSNGSNTTPIYNYSTIMGTQPGASNDEELFTASGGTVSLGQLASGTFTPWMTVGSSAVSVLSKKITNVANAVATTDAVNLGQLNGPLTANITLTTATTDNVSIFGVSAASKCSFTATNATAAGVASTLAGWYTLTANTFTLHHVATSAAGATYGVMCSVN